MTNMTNLIKIFLTISIVLIQFVFWIGNKNTLLFSSMIESVFDVFVMILIGYIEKISRSPADRNHPFGHWKFENIYSFFLNCGFILAALELLKSNIRDIKYHISSPPISDYDLLMIFLLSIPTILIIQIERYKLRKENSSLSNFNLVHYSVDFLKIIFLFLSFIIGCFVRIQNLDDFLSIIMIMIMVFSMFPNLIEDYKVLTDHEADEDILDKIKKITIGYNVSNIRTRVSGIKTLIYLDLNLSENTKLEEANSLRMNLETNIANSISNSIVQINIK